MVRNIKKNVREFAENLVNDVSIRIENEYDNLITQKMEIFQEKKDVIIVKCLQHIFGNDCITETGELTDLIDENKLNAEFEKYINTTIDENEIITYISDAITFIEQNEI